MPPSLLSARARVRECPYVSVQGLELLVTVLLARSRQPPPTVAAGVQHAEFAAELISLPSGLLAMVCEAIGKLKVRLGAAGVRARACRARAMGEGRRGPDARPAPCSVGKGQCSPQEVVGPYDG